MRKSCAYHMGQSYGPCGYPQWSSSHRHDNTTDGAHTKEKIIAVRTYLLPQTTNTPIKILYQLTNSPVGGYRTHVKTAEISEADNRKHELMHY
jgi:hypothetical protein